VKGESTYMNKLVNMSKIKSDIEKMLEIKLEYEFETVFYEGAYACLDSGKAIIGGKEITDLYRAFMLFSLEVKSGNKSFKIAQSRHFEKLGAFIDVSRNAVIKVSKFKEIINLMALLGFNTLHLYMEDVFDLPGYPHFGYRRGKYSHDELKEIDDYAYSMGIEVIPNIEVLGHLEQYLRYKEAEGFRESESVLFCGNDKAYEFIEAMIKTMRKCFRTDKIITHCDEAGTVGIPKMLEEKKYISTYDTAIWHLAKVVEICKKYGFESSVLDGDFFYFHMGIGYYDFEFNPKDDDIKKIPDVKINYWDYYHTDYTDYDTLMKGHLSLGKEVVFLGGMWIWCGQLPNVDFTFRTMEPALKCCVDYNIKEVSAATFGDDGNETNIAFALPTLLVFSEYCFNGNDYSTEKVYELSKRLLNLDMEMLRAVSDYHYPWIEGLDRSAYIWPVYMGKRIFYADVLYNQTDTYQFSHILSKHIAALKEIKNYGGNTPYNKYFKYAKQIFEITTEKIPLIENMRNAYAKKDIDWLKTAAEVSIPSLVCKYKKLMEIHEEQWLDTYKPFGWEELNNRYAGIIARLEYAKRRIENYLCGKIESIPELEYEFIEGVTGQYNLGGDYWYNKLKSCGI